MSISVLANRFVWHEVLIAIFYLSFNGCQLQMTDFKMEERSSDTLGDNDTSDTASSSGNHTGTDDNGGVDGGEAVDDDAGVDTDDMGYKMLPCVDEEKEFTGISVGGTHVCVTLGDCSMKCAGNNNRGQAEVPRDSSFARMATAQWHTCGLAPNGVVSCWGWEDSGRLNVPEKAINITEIASVMEYTCALRLDGVTLCWGKALSFEVQFPEDERFKHIAAGLQHACGLTVDGHAVCWGNNEDGACTPPDTRELKQLTLGLWFTCGLQVDGTPVCWGSNMYQQLIIPEDETFTKISAGSTFICGLRPTGTVTCWGQKDFFEDVEVPYVLAEEVFTDLSLNREQICGLRQSDNIPICWGDIPSERTGEAAYRQVDMSKAGHLYGLNLDGTIHMDSFGYLLLAEKPFQGVVAGDFYTCGLKEDGTVACLGAKWTRQNAPQGEKLIDLSGADSYLCGLKEDSHAVCWDASGAVASPQDITLMSIAAGTDGFNCGLTEAGNAFCWKGAERYQIEVPVVVDAGAGTDAGTGAARFTSISAGNDFACALTDTEQVVCWESGGEVRTDIIESDETVVDIDVHNDTACAAKNEGNSIICWDKSEYLTRKELSSLSGLGFKLVTQSDERICGIDRSDEVRCNGEASVFYPIM